MATKHRLDPVLVHAEEYEGAIVQSLEAIDGGSREAKLRAFRRFRDAARCIAGLAPEERERADHHLQDRGEIKPEDEQEVVNAMNLLEEELNNQLDLFEDGPAGEPVVHHHVHIFY